MAGMMQYITSQVIAMQAVAGISTRSLFIIPRPVDQDCSADTYV